jgi:hypothetical protein
MEKKKRGGPRPNSGRPPKIEEIKIIEQMDAICVPDKIWEALLMKCAQGDTNALKLWLSYRFGLPKQQIDVTSNGEKIAPPIQWIGRNAAITAAKVINDDDDEQSENEALIQLEGKKQLDELQIKISQDYQNLLDQDKENKQFDMFL